MQALRHFRSFFGNRSRFLITILLLLGTYLYFFLDQIIPLLSYPEILIAPIMSLGSFVAGATFLGGGAIAFPSLTKFFNTDPHTAKLFSFAIQSVGMSSASFYILTKISVFPIKFIFLYLSGATVGLLLSLNHFQTLLAPADIRVGFTLFVLCFFIIYLWTHKKINTQAGKTQFSTPFTHHNILLNSTSVVICLVCAFIGGAVSGLIGSGADLLAFCLLTLYFRIEIKLATQLSVIIMAFISIVGVLVELSHNGKLPRDVTKLWLIAAPIVLLGAPMGAYFCRKTTSTALLLFISCIVFAEVASTLALIDIHQSRYIFYVACFLLALAFLLFIAMLSPYRSNTLGLKFKQDG